MNPDFAGHDSRLRTLKISNEIEGSSWRILLTVTAINSGRRGYRHQLPRSNRHAHRLYAGRVGRSSEFFPIIGRSRCLCADRGRKIVSSRRSAPA